MNRTALINYLIQLRGARRYLEIGVHQEQLNFAHVRCAHKLCVVPRAASTLQTAYEDFFKQAHEPYDVIFIDGIHTEAQVLQDVAHGLRCLSKTGIIVLHDCMPPDAWHQREPEAYREGENWNGTVWKAALRVFNETGYKCTLLDTDWGCGLIDAAGTQAATSRRLPENLSYEMHYAWLLEYKTSVAAYLRQHLQVFYHLACMHNWKKVFTEQMEQLSRQRFLQINLTVLGSTEQLETAEAICAALAIDTQVVFHAEELHHFEKPALLAIESYARRHDGHVLYLHSKGVSNPADHSKTKWRRLMMRELVDNWQRCVLQLPHYDAIGVNWREMPPTSHFCGNFWYASTPYLRKLADFVAYYDNPRYPTWDALYNKRLSCEFWISSAREKPRVLSLFCKNVDFCNPAYWVHVQP